MHMYDVGVYVCVYTYIYIYIYTHTHIHIYILYTRSPLQDSRHFGPSPWKILALIV